MILYIDETENDDFFIVAGVLFPDEKDMETAYKQFKKKVENLELKPSVKAKVYTEFKGNFIEKKAKRVKDLIMQSLQESAQKIIYGIYKKPTSWARPSLSRAVPAMP